MGQLGIREQIQCCSFPMLVPFFNKTVVETVFNANYNFSHKRIVESVYCGAYHSLAITTEGDLYGWGESRCGQLGLGRKIKEPLPKKIEINEKIVMAAAGYQHTLALTENGEIYAFGLNNKCQLGIGKAKSQYSPVKLTDNYFGYPLPKFQKVVCGHFNNFGLSTEGHVYSWGSGILGFKGFYEISSPRLVEAYLEERIITDIFANETYFSRKWEVETI